MEIVFESTGNTAGFENWLTAFKTINDSLLIEVDTNKEQFVAKTHTVNKDIVKYGKISFESAGYKVAKIINRENKEISLEEWNSENNNNRIMIGILNILDKFIKVVDRFSGTDGHKMIFEFVGEQKFVSDEIMFQSAALDMTVRCADVDEFTYIDDSQFFNKIANIQNPLSFSVTNDIGKSLIDISGIFAMDVKKDILELKTVKVDNDWLLHAIDRSNGTYDYKLAYLESGDNPIETSLPVIRNTYFMATKGDSENYLITVPGVQNGGKIRISSGDFITVVATVRM